MVETVEKVVHHTPPPAESPFVEDVPPFAAATPSVAEEAPAFAVEAPPVADEKPPLAEEAPLGCGGAVRQSAP